MFSWNIYLQVQTIIKIKINHQFPVTEEYSETALSIPIYPNLKKKEQKKIIILIKLFFKKYAL